MAGGGRRANYLTDEEKKILAGEKKIDRTRALSHFRSTPMTMWR